MLKLQSKTGTPLPVRDSFSSRDGENEVDCPDHLRHWMMDIRADLQRTYVLGWSEGGLRLRQSTMSGILAWAVSQAIDDPEGLSPKGLTYSRCFELAAGVAKGTPAEKMPDWMPVAAILVRAHQS